MSQEKCQGLRAVFHTLPRAAKVSGSGSCAPLDGFPAPPVYAPRGGAVGLARGGILEYGKVHHNLSNESRLVGGTEPGRSMANTAGRWWAVGLIGALAGGGVAWGELRWDRQEVRFAATPDQTSVTAEFPFQNTGRRAVALDFEPNCDCTNVTVEPNQKTFAPQAAGKIVLRFELGERVGPQEKLVHLVTDEPGQPRVTLTLQGTVPELVRYEPRILYWEAGEARGTKTIRLTLAPGSTWQLTAVQPNNPIVTAELKPGRQERQYELAVTPARGEGMTILTLTSNHPAEKPRTFQVFSRVFGPAASQPAGGTPAR